MGGVLRTDLLSLSRDLGSIPATKIGGIRGINVFRDLAPAGRKVLYGSARPSSHKAGTKAVELGGIHSRP